jgi:Tfp pilus assembly protein PilF
MLAGMPDDVTFQRQLARGYMLNNQPEYALEVWFNILEKNPDEYDTLIDIASYYEQTDEHSRAVTYWQRAYKLRETPYVKSKLN